MTEYIIRLVQKHETFRRPELESLAYLAGIDMQIVDYSDEVRKILPHEGDEQE